MGEQKRPRIHIGPDGTIHMGDDDKGKPKKKRKASPALRSDGTIHVDDSADSGEKDAQASSPSRSSGPASGPALLITCPDCGAKIRIARPEGMPTIKLTCPRCGQTHRLRFGGQATPADTPRQQAPAQVHPKAGKVKTVVLTFLAWLFSSSVLMIPLVATLGSMGFILGMVGGLFVAAFAYRKLSGHS